MAEKVSGTATQVASMARSYGANRMSGFLYAP